MFAPLFALLLAPVAFPDDDPRPPYERRLQGEDLQRYRQLIEQIRRARDEDRLADAVVATQALLTLRETKQGKDHPDTVLQRWELRVLQTRQGFTAGQRAAWDEADRARIEASRLDAAGQYRAAADTYRKLLSAWRELLGDEHPYTATAWNGLGMCLVRLGRIEEGQEMLEKGLAVGRATLGESHPDTASHMILLGFALNERGRYAEARSLTEKALEVLLHTRGEYHHQTVQGYNNLANILVHQGKLAEARPYLTKCLDITVRLRGEKHYAVATAYNNLGMNLDEQGKHAEAEPLLRKALTVRQEVLGERHPDTAMSYNNLARTLGAQGRFAEAEPLHLRAVEITRRTLGDEHYLTAVVLLNLGNHLFGQGKWTEAGPLILQAESILRKRLGADHPSTAAVMVSRAAVLDELGDQQEAEKLLREVIAVWSRVYSVDHPRLAKVYNNLAGCLDKQKKYEEAAGYLRRALAIRRATLGPNNPESLSSERNQAMIPERQGKLDEVIAIYADSLAKTRRVCGEQHPDTILTRRMLATYLQQGGQWEKALPHLEAAALALEAARTRISDRGLERVEFTTRQSPYLPLAITRLRLGRKAEAWQALESALARGLLDEETAASGKDTEDRQRYVTLRQQIDDLQARLLPLLATDDLPAERRPERDRLLQERGRLEQELGELAALRSRREVTTLARLQATLPDDAALVAWVDDGPAGYRVCEHWGCVVRSRGEPVWVQLPGSGPERRWSEADDLLPSRMRRALADPDAPTAEKDALLKHLHDQRRAPLQPHLAGVRRLYLVSAGWMSGVPVVALSDPTVTSCYVPSATHLVRLLSAKQTPREPHLLAVGDPAFPAEELQARRAADTLLGKVRGPVFQELPGGRREIEAIRTLFPRADVFTGSDAGEERLDELRSTSGLAGYTHLHFATHGLANPHRAFDTALVLAQDHLPDNALRVTQGLKPIDGRLTAREVLDGWKLDADLVVLSACETGLGKYGGGEGMLGFSQAFLLAGARSVVLSLWKVDDNATALLMTRFYQNLLGKREGLTMPLGKAAALAEARQWLRTLSAEQADTAIARLPRGATRSKPAAEGPTTRPYAHPHCWAAFILIGDPR